MIDLRIIIKDLLIKTKIRQNYNITLYRLNVFWFCMACLWSGLLFLCEQTAIEICSNTIVSPYRFSYKTKQIPCVCNIRIYSFKKWCQTNLFYSIYDFSHRAWYIMIYIIDISCHFLLSKPTWTLSWCQSWSVLKSSKFSVCHNYISQIVQKIFLCIILYTYRFIYSTYV